MKRLSVSSVLPQLLAALFVLATNTVLVSAQRDIQTKPAPATTADTTNTTPPNTTRERKVTLSTAAPITEEQRKILRRGDLIEEEAAIVPYVNNFFATARLGPEDVIAVDVFDKPNYSRGNIIIPPDGVISYPQIGRVELAGRTIPEIEKEITERLREYIIDPQVTIQLSQSHSQKFFVVGDVNSPGIYDMARRMTVTEALARAGWINKYGDRQKVAVLRAQPDGKNEMLPINMKEVEAGRIRDFYLVPGDTIVVPGNKYKTAEKVLNLAMMAVWLRIFVP